MPVARGDNEMLRPDALHITSFDQMPASEQRQGYFGREPIGVIDAITPFNDPLIYDKNLPIYRLY